jgi:iron complex outermembrane receptor protein
VKKYIITLLLWGMAFSIKAQGFLEGKIMDSLSSEPVQGVSVLLLPSGKIVQSDRYGSIQIPKTENSLYTLVLNAQGYQKKTITKSLEKSGFILLLSRIPLLKEGLIIRSTRAQERDGTVFTLIGKKELEKDNIGEDLPFLLENTPSLVATSEAGAGVGYTGIRIRGSDATRVNVTLNGIPYNDSESLGTYFVDIPDIAASVGSIQIQRGVGSSTNGAGSFGGSINIETSSFEPKAYFNASTSYGSYNTLKNSLDMGTGLLADHFNFSLRLSRISSDGYIDRASSNLKSFFFSGAYFGKKDLLKVNIFSGSEKTYQVFDGVPEDSLPTNRRFNPFNYANQTDNYIQDHYQGFYSRQIDTSLSLNLALHVTHGKGYYEEYETQQAFSDYSLPNFTLGNTTVDSTNLIRRQWLDNYFYGTTYSLIYKSPKKWNLNFGGAYNQYTGLHYGQVIWAEYAVNIPIDYRYYAFNGFKTDFNSYLKVSREFGALSTNLDLQYRRIYYRFLGYDENGNNTTQVAILNFFNPKIGLHYQVPKGEIYGSYGIGNKEPNQLDYSGSTPSSRPRPEHLEDLELGYRHAGKILKYGINFYWMDYWDQLALTGQINDVGAQINTNVPRSSRTGIEGDWSLKVNSWFSFLGNLAFSQNKIREFDEYLTDENNVQTLIRHYNSNLAYSPNWIGSSTLDFKPISNFHILLVNKFVGKQYLDNTSNETRKIDRYFVQNIRIHYSMKFTSVKALDFSLSLNNIFSNLYVSDGYTGPQIILGKVVNNNYYYPQAPFNVLGGFTIHF